MDPATTEAGIEERNDANETVNGTTPDPGLTSEEIMASISPKTAMIILTVLLGMAFLETISIVLLVFRKLMMKRKTNSVDPKDQKPDVHFLTHSYDDEPSEGKKQRHGEGRQSKKTGRDYTQPYASKRRISATREEYDQTYGDGTLDYSKYSVLSEELTQRLVKDEVQRQLHEIEMKQRARREKENEAKLQKEETQRSEASQKNKKKFGRKDSKRESKDLMQQKKWLSEPAAAPKSPITSQKQGNEEKEEPREPKKNTSLISLSSSIVDRYVDLVEKALQRSSRHAQTDQYSDDSSSGSYLEGYTPQDYLLEYGETTYVGDLSTSYEDLSNPFKELNTELNKARRVSFEPKANSLKDLKKNVLNFFPSDDQTEEQKAKEKINNSIKFKIPNAKQVDNNEAPSEELGGKEAEKYSNNSKKSDPGQEKQSGTDSKKLLSNSTTSYSTQEYEIDTYSRISSSNSRIYSDLTPLTQEQQESNNTENKKKTTTTRVEQESNNTDSKKSLSKIIKSRPVPKEEESSAKVTWQTVLSVLHNDKELDEYEEYEEK